MSNPENSPQVNNICETPIPITEWQKRIDKFQKDGGSLMNLLPVIKDIPEAESAVLDAMTDDEFMVYVERLPDEPEDLFPYKDNSGL